MKVLVVGGAGYIGSHMVLVLRRAGHEVIVLDDLSTGHRDAVGDAELVVGDAGDRGVVEPLLARGIDAVMHFASKIRVDESVADPAVYYRTNVTATLALLDAMIARGVRRIVFSSSAAVYGEPATSPIHEDHPQRPTNPYGRTKAIIEGVLADYHAAYALDSVSLRYFNAAGADPSGTLGERHDPETHLLPLVLQAASGRRPALTIHGDDWPTPDGTCIRDFVHVVDLCTAHMLALDWMTRHGGSTAFNLGSGRGASIREAVSAAERVTGRSVPVVVGPRRAGDPARLVAAADRARDQLGWTPRYPDLDTILAHAWAWERSR